MHRFFVEPFSGERLRVGRDLSRRMRRVLRLGRGDEVVLFDGTGREYRAVIEELGEEISLRILESYFPDRDPRVEVYLYQSILKGERFEFVLEKGTELGASGFIPLVTERCVVKNPGGEKLRRWRRIIVEACEQCGRTLIPELRDPVSFKEAIEASGFSIFLSKEGERPQDVLSRYEGGRINIFTGPEGDFSDREISLFKEKGFLPVSLGGRTLRSETASIALLSILLDRLNL